MPQPIPSKRPAYGVDFGRGWIGFQTTRRDFISVGIAAAEAPFAELGGSIVASHTFVATGPNECIEAQASGVVVADLASKFADPHCIVWFRKPYDWTPDMGEEIVAGASLELGKRYNYAMIGAHLFSKVGIGRLVDWATRGWLTDKLTHLADRKNEDICSMVSAKAMQRSALLREALEGHEGCLDRDAHDLTPDDLDDDPRIFEPKGATV